LRKLFLTQTKHVIVLQYVCLNGVVIGPFKQDLNFKSCGWKKHGSNKTPH